MISPDFYLTNCLYVTFKGFVTAASLFSFIYEDLSKCSASFVQGKALISRIITDFLYFDLWHLCSSASPMIYPNKISLRHNSSRTIAYGYFCQCRPSKRVIWGMLVGRRPTNIPHFYPFSGRNACTCDCLDNSSMKSVTKRRCRVKFGTMPQGR
jgi:hypothetical protein